MTMQWIQPAEHITFDNRERYLTETYLTNQPCQQNDWCITQHFLEKQDQYYTQVYTDRYTEKKFVMRAWLMQLWKLRNLSEMCHLQDEGLSGDVVPICT